MNWDQIETNWAQLQGSVKLRWNKLTDEQLGAIAGKRDQLAARIKELYQGSAEDTERQLAQWQATAAIPVPAPAK